MALTPEDVSNKRFTAVRLREGYDMGEVDQFLDEVEAELTRLVTENEELRAKLEAAQSGQPIPETPVAEKQPEPEAEAPAEEPAEVEEPAEAPAEETAPEPEAEAEPEPAERFETPPRFEAESGTVAAPTSEVAAEPQERVVETIQVTTTADASKAATRLLELAGANADALVAEAQEQAEQILGDARSQAEAVEAEALTRAEQLDNETAERRQQLFGDLEAEKSELDAEVERLKEFERAYRTELKGYFEQQLEALEGRGEPGTLHSTDA